MMDRLSTTERKVMFIVTCLFLASLVVLAVVKQWGGQSYYVEAYRPEVERSQAYKQAQQDTSSSSSDSNSQPSVEPSPMGFKESDIDKSEGNRYKAF